MSSKFKQVHEDAARKAQGWTFREQFLDTDRLRRISYGNLVLRREAHLFLTHGVVVAVLFLLLFWLVSANWNRVMAMFGGESSKQTAVECYEVVTNVTQLPPPPPMAPEPPKARAAAPLDAPKVGKIKKVAEAPPDQTFATQKEIKQAITQGPASQDGGGSSASCETIVEFVNCQNPPTVVSTPRLIYPEMARIAGLEGRVFVRVLISEEGRPMKAEVVKRIPADQTVFDKEATRIAMETKYTAGVQNGRRVRVWMTIPVRFTLHEG
ncbi:energy transducer TonB [Chlorobaculum limnaeum]|uniref:Energy transducer TonB n=1 Tax=Chlorobaculum limnaeum TaxID=274537 RepID=A0A1D8D5K5_CHLLM|nr:energy transducer TonB [Chlorobaculum limnaeum]AOS83158.1 energy transducer TonB [Chlorobaculum limnaeum]